LTEQLVDKDASFHKAEEKDEARRQVLKKAGSLLLHIHHAVATEAQTQDPNSNQLAFDSSLYSAIMGLVDLLTVEGIYPSLPKDAVSVAERRKKSLLFPNAATQSPLTDDLRVSDQILGEVFDPIILGQEQGVQFLLRERFLSDVIIGNANLAYSPQFPLETNSRFRRKLHDIIDQLPTPTVYRLLTEFVKPSSPDWLRMPLAEHLALLPLRPSGVRHLIEFIAASFPPVPKSSIDEDSKSSQGPALPIEALTQASKVLSSPPRGQSMKTWLSQIAPQLLKLLDGEGGKELSTAVAYIIGSGILGKRLMGAPGSVGWELFAEPIISALNPPSSIIQSKVSPPSKRKANGHIEIELVSQAELDLALTRLAMLITSHPNTGLTARLLRPLILPLWGLANYDNSPAASRWYREIALSLLEAYFKLSGSLPQLQLLTQNIIWTGTSDWAFAPGGSGGLAIRNKSQQSSKVDNVLSTIDKVDTRIIRFTDLLNNATIDDATLNSLFLDLSRRWLLRSIEKPNTIGTLAEEDVNPLQSFTNAKLVQAMLEKFQDRLLRNPNQLLQLIQQVLQDIFNSRLSEHTRMKSLKKPTLSGLSSIAAPDTNQPSRRLEQETSTLLNSQADTLQVVNSLLYVILQDQTKLLQDDSSIKATLEVIRSLLSDLLVSQPPLDPNLRSSLTATQSLVASTISPQRDATAQPEAKAATEVTKRLATLAQIQTELASELPPIRVSALADLEELTNDPSTPLDVPSTTLLLLDVIRADSEEFVYLRAIKTLTMFSAARGAGFAVRMVSDAFQDATQESGVDGRLRVGEALSSIADAVADDAGGGYGTARMGAAERGGAVRTIAETALVVAGRRGRRTKEIRERERSEQLQRERMKNAEKAWGGEVPPLPALEDDVEDDQLTDEQRMRHEKELDAIEVIVKGWQDTGFEEDVRLRASAMSIIGHILEKNMGMLGDRLIEDSIEMALSILALEREPPKAILRRAAVLVFMSLLSALDHAHEEQRSIEVNISPEKWKDVERVLKWTSEVDDDEITKGHAETILESLENWRMKQLMGLRQMDSEYDPRFGLEGKLRGLAVTPGEEPKSKRYIEEIE